MKTTAKVAQPLFFCDTYNFFTKYLPTHKTGSEHTMRSYKTALKQWADYVTDVAGLAIDQFHFEDATYDFVLDYRNYLREKLELSESTCNNRLAFLRTYIQYSAARDLSLQPIAFSIGQVPFYKVPEHRQPIIEDVDALEALLNAPKNTDKGLRDKTMLSVLYDGGLREDELLSLTIGDVRWGINVELSIHGKGAKERVVILTEQASALLNQYRTVFHQELDPARPLFYTVIGGQIKTMTTRNLRKKVATYANQIRDKFDLPKSVSPHALRRTRGTYLYRAGVPLEIISLFLGHSSVEVTKKHYAFPSEEQMLYYTHVKAHMIPGVTITQPEEKNPPEEKLFPSSKEKLYRSIGL